MDISIDKVCEIIAHLRAVGVKEEISDPDSGSNPTDDKVIDALQDTAPDGTRQQVIGVINGLDEDERLDLVALIWLGRGDYEPAEWLVARAAARERRVSPTAKYILGIPNAADLMEEGLAARGLSCGS